MLRQIPVAINPVTSYATVRFNRLQKKLIEQFL